MTTPLAVSWVIDGRYRPLVPEDVIGSCHRTGLTTAHWEREVQLVSWPVGADPGKVRLLFTRADVLDMGVDGTHTLEIACGLTRVMFSGLVVSAPCVNVTTGLKKDPRSVYLVEFSDARHLLKSRTLGGAANARYNVVSADDGETKEYHDDSLNDGETWTWQELLDDLWESSGADVILGDPPTLPEFLIADDPVTPTDDGGEDEWDVGIPENVRFVGTSAWEAYNAVLRKLGCVFVLLPDGTYSLSRVGVPPRDADGGGNLFAEAVAKYNAEGSAWRDQDDEAVEITGGLIPEAVNVYFLHPITRKAYPVEVDCPETVFEDVTEGTRVFLWDDLSARTDDEGELTNEDELRARAELRASDYYRALYYQGERNHYVFQRFLNDRGLMPSGVVAATFWYDRGAGPRTEVYYEPAFFPEVPPEGCDPPLDEAPEERSIRLDESDGLPVVDPARHVSIDQGTNLKVEDLGNAHGRVYWEGVTWYSNGSLQAKRIGGDLVPGTNITIAPTVSGDRVSYLIAASTGGGIRVRDLVPGDLTDPCTTFTVDNSTFLDWANVGGGEGILRWTGLSFLNNGVPVGIRPIFNIIAGNDINLTLIDTGVQVNYIVNWTGVNWYHNGVFQAQRRGGDIVDSAYVTATPVVNANRVSYTLNWTGVDWYRNGVFQANRKGGDFVEGAYVTIVPTVNAGNVSFEIDWVGVDWYYENASGVQYINTKPGVIFKGSNGVFVIGSDTAGQQVRYDISLPLCSDQDLTMYRTRCNGVVNIRETQVVTLSFSEGCPLLTFSGWTFESYQGCCDCPQAGPCCDCAAVPSVWALVVSGIAGDDCPNGGCALANGRWELAVNDLGDCTWDSGDADLVGGTSVCYPGTATWTLRCDATDWVLQMACPGGLVNVWKKSRATWNCLSANTLTFVGPAECCDTLPALLTVTPI